MMLACGISFTASAQFSSHPETEKRVARMKAKADEYTKNK